MKKIAILSLAMLVGSSMYGCFFNAEDNSRSDRMVEYINDKYDDEFTFESVYGGHVGSDNHKIIVSSEKFPGEEIIVFCDASGDEEVYSDNYLGIKFEEQTAELISDTLSEAFGEDPFIYYFPSDYSMTSGASDDTSFEEYISSPSSGIDFIAIVNCKADEFSEDEVVGKVQNCLKDAGICATGTMFFDTQGTDISNLNGDDYYENYVVYEKYSGRLHFNMDEDLDFSSYKWTEPDVAEDISVSMPEFDSLPDFD